MNLRFIEWNNSIYIVIGIGYDSKCDPPDVYHAIPLTTSIVKDVILNENLTIVPVSEAIEITDKNKINAIYILYR